jgi:hypothetical protein
MPTTKTRPLIRNTPTTRAALAFTAGIVAIAASNNANALDTFNYARYPASATVNQSCQGSDVQTSSVKIDNVEVTRFYAGGRLHPGSVVNWVFSTGNANCANDVATIALYATDGDQNSTARKRSLARPARSCRPARDR